MLVLDTAALLYWTNDPKKLSSPAKEAINAVNQQLIVSSISIWEIALKVRRSRLEIAMPLGEFVSGLYRVDILEILPVDVEMWLLSIDMDWAHRDPADRVIVATAKLLNAPLISPDNVIRAYYSNAIW